MALFHWFRKLISRFTLPRRSAKTAQSGRAAAVPRDKREHSSATRADDRKNVYPLF
jgi:hypothetical protein